MPDVVSKHVPNRMDTSSSPVLHKQGESEAEVERVGGGRKRQAGGEGRSCESGGTSETASHKVCTTKLICLIVNVSCGHCLAHCI